MKVLTLLLMFISLTVAQTFNKSNVEEEYLPKIKNGNVELYKNMSVDSEPTEILMQIWVPENWVDESRTQMDYNSNGFLTLMKQETLNESEWILDYKYEIIYDGDILTEDYAYFYDEGTVQYAIKHTYQMSGEKVNELITYNWDETTTDWIPFQKEEFVYTGDVNTKINITEWNEYSSEWEASGEITYTYDNQNREIEALEKIWSNSEDDFQNSYITTTTYHSNGEQESQLSKSWDVIENQWSDSNFTLYEWDYDANTNCTCYIFTSQISIMGFTIVTKGKDEYEYDGNNLMISDTYSSWEDYASTWVEVSLSEYSYNAQDDILEIIIKGFGSDNWVNLERHIYSYNSAVDVNDRELISEFKLNQNYPNPFNPSTIISYYLPSTEKVTLEVFDVLGNKIKTLVNSEQQAGSYAIKFDASKYSSGIYFYNLKYGTTQSITKKCLLTK